MGSCLTLIPITSPRSCLPTPSPSASLTLTSTELVHGPDQATWNMLKNFYSLMDLFSSLSEGEMLPSSAYSLISRLTHYERDLKRDLGPTASRSAIRHRRPELTKLDSAGLKTVKKGDQKLPLKSPETKKSRRGEGPWIDLVPDTGHNQRITGQKGSHKSESIPSYFFSHVTGQEWGIFILWRLIDLFMKRR